MANNKEITSSSEDDESSSSYMVYCNLCKTGFSSTVPYRQHMKGSQHKKNETKKFMKEKYGEKYLEAMGKLAKGEATGTSVEEAAEAAANAKDDDALILTCTLCKKVCTGYLPYQLHMASKSHAKQVKKEQLIAALKKDNVTVTKSTNELFDTIPELQPFGNCDVCKKSFTGPEEYKKHFDSAVHKREIAKKKLKEDLQKNGDGTDKFVEDSEDGLFLVTCEICNKGFSGVIPYKQHLISEAHKNKEKDGTIAEKIGHLAIQNEEGSIKCNECSQVFSGIKPFYQHIQGPAHAKLKKKNEILQELQSTFPEFLKESAKADEDGDSDTELDFLLCSICHKSFSGPESARDHFRSKKHLKAKKEKMRIDKLKQEKKLHLKAMKDIVNLPSSTSKVSASSEGLPEKNLKAAKIPIDYSDEFEMI